MSLPDAIIVVLAHFEPCFTQPTWHKAVLLLVGTLLARGRRTVASALRLTGHTHDPSFSRFITSSTVRAGCRLPSASACCASWSLPLGPQVLVSRSWLTKRSNVAGDPRSPSAATTVTHSCRAKAARSIHLAYAGSVSRSWCMCRGPVVTGPCLSWLSVSLRPTLTPSATTAIVVCPRLPN